MRNFWASDQSVVAVEFAVVAPAFLFLICVSLETFRIQVARVIVQRAIYSMAYEAKTAKDRDADFGAMAAAIIERLRNKMVFAANEVEVKFYSSPTFEGVVDPKTASAGAGDVEHIALVEVTANFGLLKRILPDAGYFSKEVFKYYYINEPGV